MALKGNFETFFLSSILELLHNDLKTGVLHAQHNGKEAKIYVHEGTIVYASGSSKEARLGYILQHKGLITKEQLNECLASGADKKNAVGKALVEKGYISKDALKEAVRKQAEGIIYNLFLWEQGDFEYRDAKLNLNGVVVTNLNIQALLLEASRRIDELSVLKKQIPSPDILLTISDKALAKTKIQLNAGEWAILTLLMEKDHSVKVLIEKTGFETATVYNHVYALLSSGIIEQSDQIQFAGAGSDKTYSEIVRIYNAVFQAVCHNLQIEIGEMAVTVINDCKPDTVPQNKHLFVNFHPINPAALNVHAILEAMKGFENLESGRSFLLNKFNEFLINIFAKISEILGLHPTLKILEDTKNVLTFLKKNHPEESEGATIIVIITDHLKQFENALSQNYGANPSTNGLKSALRT